MCLMGATNHMKKCLDIHILISSEKNCSGYTAEKISKYKIQVAVAHILCFLLGFTVDGWWCQCTLLLYLLTAVSISPVYMCVLNIYSIDSHSWHCSAWENTPLFLCVVSDHVSIQSSGVCIGL